MPSQPGKSDRQSNANRASIYRMKRIFLELKALYPKRDSVERYPSAKVLAALCDNVVGEEAIRDDIRSMIRDLDLPIEFFPARWGYCFTAEVTHFPLDQIAEGDVFLLTVSGKSLASFHGMHFGSRMKELVRKITGHLAQSILDDVGRMESLISFHAGGFEAPIDGGLFELVCGAVFDQEELTFTYTKIDDHGEPEAPEHRHVQPRHLAHVDGAWYLIADDLNRALDHRTFALTRMSEVVRTGKRFVPTKDLDVEKLINESFGIFTGGKKVKVRLKFYGKSRGLIAERHWHETQKLTPLPAERAMGFEMTVPQTPILNRWVLGWGRDVEVIGPAALKKKIRWHVEGMLARLDGKKVL